MNKKTVILHAAWAFIAGGAWWLGSQSTADDSPRFPGRSRSPDVAERTEAGAHPARGTSGAVTRTAELATWLDTWRSADGHILPERMSAAVLAALRDPDQVRGLRNFTHLLDHLKPENAAAAVLTLKSNAGASDSGVWLEILCAAWGAKDGASALIALTEKKDREAAMSAWAATDPAAAQAWLAGQSGIPNPYWRETNPDWNEDNRRDMERSLVSGLARRDVKAAEAYIAAQAERDRGDLARVVAKEMFRRGGPDAAEWAAGLEDSTMRASALEMVARKYMAAIPAEGATWAAENATAPDMRAAVGRVADRIAENDVLAAYTWTQQLPAGPGQEEAYQQVFSQWAREDPTASSQELLHMTPSPNRDQAIHSFSRSLVKENPESAIAWAGAISDSAQRLETQIDVARQWHSAAPEPAAAWITANLPADARAKAMAAE
jgi:hypothetical protein